MNSPPFRPTHARMCVFLRHEETRAARLRSALEATGRAHCSERLADPTRSRFASKFGVGLERAISRMIDLYGWRAVAAHVNTDASRRLAELLAEDGYDSHDWDAVLAKDQRAEAAERVTSIIVPLVAPGSKLLGRTAPGVVLDENAPYDPT